MLTHVLLSLRHLGVGAKSRPAEENRVTKVEVDPGTKSRLCEHNGLNLSTLHLGSGTA